MDPLPAPRVWIDPIAAALQARLPGRSIEGAVSGPGWLSLRIDGEFLWLMTRGDVRLCVLGQRPFPGRWLDVLGRHDRSPFANHLRGLRVEAVEVLETDRAQVDGLQLRLSGGNVLALRVWPRPGAIWLGGPEEILARLGRMEGPDLAARPPDGPADDGTLAAQAETALRTFLTEQVTQTLRQRAREREQRQTRLIEHLQRDLDRAEEQRGLRGVADLLAAHLHLVKPGMESMELTGFDGDPVTVPLDPSLDASANLSRLYKRAGKAERAQASLQQRLTAARDDLAAQGELPDPLPDPLDDLLELADAHGLDLTPRRRTAQRQARDTPRLPYYRYRLADGTEIRVGRSARDNDAMLREHSTGSDLWLHAQGVEGSHVLIRGDREPSAATLEAAARLAAHYSKARTSSTVAVVVTQRRYVRKPRKAAPGSVVAERGKTLFVTPGIPEGCERQGQSDPRVR